MHLLIWVYQAQQISSYIFQLYFVFSSGKKNISKICCISDKDET